MAALREIKKYQKTGDLLIRRLPFSRIVRDIADGYMAGVRFQASAILALQECTEAWIVAFLESKYVFYFLYVQLMRYRFKPGSNTCEARHRDGKRYGIHKKDSSKL